MGPRSIDARSLIQCGHGTGHRHGKRPRRRAAEPLVIHNGHRNHGRSRLLTAVLIECQNSCGYESTMGNATDLY